MVYKISDNAHIIVENGETILVADVLKFEDSITIGSVDSSLSPSYITDNLSSPSYTFQGSTNSYNTGGSPGGHIEKFPFAIASGTATSVGDLTSLRGAVSGQSSASHGYTSGNDGVQSGLQIPYKIDLFKIDKFPFASDANATDVGQLSTLIKHSTGHSSENNGYISGGAYQSGNPPALTVTHPPLIGGPIEKFPFASDTNSSLVAELTVSRYQSAGISGSTHGYTAGGHSPSSPTTYNVIDRFPFSSDANATDVGDLSVTRDETSGHSSSFAGFAVGGNYPNKSRDRFPFATDANGADGGDLDYSREGQGETSGETDGFVAGGYGGPPFSGTGGYRSAIEKFPFFGGGSTEVGDLSGSRYRPAGQQV